MSMNRNWESVLPWPSVIEKEGRYEREYGILSRLLKDRIVILSGQVNTIATTSIIAQLLFLSNEDSKKDIHFYINSPGGSITDGLAIYDTMQFLRCEVATYCVGQAASMAAMLLTGGKSGKRFMLKNSRVLLHQPLITGVLTGPATDLDIEAKEILRLRERLYNILAEHTGQKPDKIEKDCDRNLWLEADEAIAYGLADRIIQKAPEIVKSKKSTGRLAADSG